MDKPTATKFSPALSVKVREGAIPPPTPAPEKCESVKSHTHHIEQKPFAGQRKRTFLQRLRRYSDPVTVGTRGVYVGSAKARLVFPWLGEAGTARGCVLASKQPAWSPGGREPRTSVQGCRQ